MNLRKHQKKYNEQVMQTGYKANEYYRNALSLIDKYTSGYADRNEFWVNKLNNRQLDLLSDKYLAQNASMLRGSAAFGSNSETNRQMENNAYSQQNYLANVANQNVMDANKLQNNELNALGNAASTYNAAVAIGGQAAQNVDAANTAWLNVLGSNMSQAGQVLSAIPTPWTQAVGGALQAGGGAVKGMSTESADLAASREGIAKGIDAFKSGYQDYRSSGSWLKAPSVASKSTSSLSTTNNFINNNGIGNFGLNTKQTMPSFKGFN